LPEKPDFSFKVVMAKTHFSKNPKMNMNLFFMRSEDKKDNSLGAQHSHHITLNQEQAIKKIRDTYEKGI